MMNFLIFFTVLCATVGHKGSLGLTIELIHRDSPLSPFYDSSMSRSEILLRGALRSISRAAWFSHFIATRDSKAVEAIMMNPEEGLYLTRIFIGDPPTEQMVCADTGSSLTWVQCKPCKACLRQDAPIFDPFQSRSYMVLPCAGDICWRYMYTYNDCHRTRKQYCS
ncbi:hypothetical protein OROGR_034146 [Orobanche gracilis]